MRILHAGCGGDPLPRQFFGFPDDAEEVRLDIDATFKPDILASIVDMGGIGPFDAAYTSHTLEHLYPHEVPVALGEFHRVLRPGGHVICIVPDLEGIKPNLDVVYECPGGPITGLHMYYGDPRMIPQFPYMAHHCGFVKETLEEVFKDAGFAEVAVIRIPTIHSLMAAAKRA